MTYRGHVVPPTLIRCHFSPAETTGGQYIYSGSANGRIHVRVTLVVGFGLLSQLYRSFLDLVARRQGRSSALPEQDTSNGIRPIRPQAAQLRWLQGRIRLRRKLAFEGKAKDVWWDSVC